MVAESIPIMPIFPLIAFVILVALLAPLRSLLFPSAALTPWHAAQLTA
jgi:uncharacterized protein HemY